jgi:hypothetical protein
METDERRGTAAKGEFARFSRGLWVEEPATVHRMPDPVRTAAVRAVIIAALTLVQAMIAFLSTLAGSWLAFPMVLSSVVSTVVATWGVLDVWVTRQVWYQRHGVVSAPSSTARQLRHERRRARRAAREAARDGVRIRPRGTPEARGAAGHRESPGPRRAPGSREAAEAAEAAEVREPVGARADEQPQGGLKTA